MDDGQSPHLPRRAKRGANQPARRRRTARLQLLSEAEICAVSSSSTPFVHIPRAWVPLA